jgi:aminocarboxymuconate-semialdehyde decarboxylase
MPIDVHAHIVPEFYLEAMQQRMGLTAERDGAKTLLRKDGYTVAWSRPEMFEVAHRLRDMDERGIDMQILSLSTPNLYPWSGSDQIELAHAANRHALDLCEQFPTRFRTFASLPLASIGAALEELGRVADDPNVVGIAIGSNIAGRRLDDPRFEPLWQALDDRDLPVFIHPMFPESVAGMDAFELPLRLGFPFDTTLAATRLIYAGVLERYVNLTFILAHTGGTLLGLLDRLDNGYHLFPDCRAHISAAPSTFARRFYYDSASFSNAYLTMAVKLVGADRLLLGTDYPFIGATTAHVTDLPILQSDRQSILGGNAMSLFGLEASNPHRS